MRVNKKEEQIFGNFFIQHFNKHHNSDYSVVLNEKEQNKDRDIDAYAISDSLEKLYLQIVTGQIKYKETVYPWLQKNQKRKAGTPTGLSLSGNRRDDIFSSIELKRSKNYSNPENLILLITEKSIAPALSSEHAKGFSERYLASEPPQFKGIYYVFNVSHRYSGGIQIVAIKDIFGNHGVIF